MTDTEKDKELTKWIEEAFSAWAQKTITYDNFNWDGLKLAFKEGIYEREQYFIDTYFKPPEGRNIISPNMNKDGFVGLESRIKADISFYEKELLPTYLTAVARNPQHYGLPLPEPGKVSITKVE